MEAQVCPICHGFREGVIWMVDAPVCTCPYAPRANTVDGVFPFVIPANPIEPAPSVPSPFQFVPTAPRAAWECPRCRRVNAPHLDHCDCQPGSFSFTLTCTTGLS